MRVGTAEQLDETPKKKIPVQRKQPRPKKEKKK